MKRPSGTALVKAQHHPLLRPCAPPSEACCGRRAASGGTFINWQS